MNDAENSYHSWYYMEGKELGEHNLFQVYCN